MWHSPHGDRTLGGAEARLARHGVLLLAKQAYGDHGPGYYGRLTGGEKLIALAAVAKALLDPHEPAPEHYAWNEATVYAAYRAVARRARDSPVAARLIRAADREVWLRFGGDPGPGEDDDQGDPDEAVEALADLVLWDRDWELERLAFSEEFDAHFVREGFDSYFSPPPVPTAERVRQAEAYLQGLRPQGHRNR
jgi:hypothetical protein